MNFASLRKLPIIFACENNLYATHMPIRDCRVGSRIRSIADPFCIEAAEVDGNDVLAVYEAGRKAVENAARDWALTSWSSSPIATGSRGA